MLLLACLVLLSVRAAEGLALVGGDDALLAFKLRTSGCGALSVSGNLATLLVSERAGAGGASFAGQEQHSLLQTSHRDGEHEGSTRLQAIRVVAINLALHAHVAAVTCVALPMLADLS